jgi:hypothetical protein
MHKAKLEPKLFANGMCRTGAGLNLSLEQDGFTEEALQQLFDQHCGLAL